jgi:hypothetical protein
MEKEGDWKEGERECCFFEKVEESERKQVFREKD